MISPKWASLSKTSTLTWAMMAMLLIVVINDAHGYVVSFATGPDSSGAAPKLGGPPTGTFSISDTDLADSSQPTFGTIQIQSGAADFNSKVSALNDGTVYGNDTSRQVTDNSFTPANGTVVLLTFDTSDDTNGRSVMGYNIRSIVCLTGSGDGQDRTGQNFKLEYSTVGSSEFTTIFNSLDTSDPKNVDAPNAETQATITGDGGDLLATDVDQLRFTFAGVGATNPESIYRELDVFGTAVPEPTLVGALGFAATVLLARRQKR